MHIREQIFYKLLEQSDSKVFDGWEEYKIDIFRFCTEFADIEVFSKKLRMKIEYLVDIYSGDEYKKYSNKNMLQILFEMIEEYGNKEESEQFIKENLNFTFFRELLINKYIKDRLC